MKLGKITFSETAKSDILALYHKCLDDEGFIVEEDNPKQRVLTPKGEEIHIDEWAGVTKGSEAFVKRDIFSLIELAKKLE